jgi:uncharacterized protein
VSLPDFISVRGDDLELRIKAVPGAKRDEIAGGLGDRLKVRVSQPPEGGRANDAIRELLAGRLGVSPRDIELVQGVSNPLKTLRIKGAAAAATRLAETIGARHVPPSA